MLNAQLNETPDVEISVTEAKKILMESLPTMTEALQVAHQRLRMASSFPTTTIDQTHEKIQSEQKVRHSSIFKTICLAAYLIPETIKLIKEFDNMYNNDELRKFLFGHDVKLSQPLFSGIAKEPPHLISSSPSFFKNARKLSGRSAKIFGAFIVAEMASEHWPELIDGMKELPAAIEENIEEYIRRGRAEMKEWQITGQDDIFEILPPTMVAQNRHEMKERSITGGDNDRENQSLSSSQSSRGKP